MKGWNLVSLNHEIHILNWVPHLSASLTIIQVPLQTFDIYDFCCIFMLANHACFLSAAYFLQFTTAAIAARECIASCSSTLALVTSAPSRSADRFNVTPAGSLLLNPFSSADQQCCSRLSVWLWLSVCCWVIPPICYLHCKQGSASRGRACHG